MANNSDYYSIYKETRNQNKIPESVLTDGFVYSLFDTTAGNTGGGEYVNGIVDILKSLTGQSQEVTFTIKLVGVVKGIWGDTGMQRTISKGLKQISSSIIIPNLESYSFAKIFATGGFVITKKPLESQVDETGAVIPKSDNSFFIQEAGEMNVGMGGTATFKLQSMNSYQWSTTKTNTGETIWKIINLKIGDIRGIMVDEIEIIFTGPFKASRKMITMTNSASLPIDFDIDFDKSFFEDWESGLEHINTLVDSLGTLTIISHTMSALKIADILLMDHNGFQGKAPNLNSKITGIAVPGVSENQYATKNEWPLFYHEHSEVEKQLNTEWYGQQDYYNIVEGFPFMSGFFVVHKLNVYWESAMYEIAPNDKISEVPFLKTISSGWDAFQPAKIPEYNFKNENRDLNSWLTGDCKIQFIKYPASTDRASLVIAKPKMPWEDGRKEYAQNIINNFINGSMSSYKGMKLEILPDTLKNNEKPDYQELLSSNQTHVNWFVISSTDPIAYYNSNKDYFEIVSPTYFKQEFIYDNQQGDLGKKTKSWPLPQSFQNLNIQLSDLFYDDNIERRITIKLRVPQPFPKTFTTRLIGGGYQFAIIQKFEGKLALDKDGNEVPTIYKELNWYKNRNTLLTRTTFDTK